MKRREVPINPGEYKVEFPSVYSENKRISVRLDDNEVIVTTISGKVISFIPDDSPEYAERYDRFIAAANAYKGDKTSFYNEYIDGDELWFLHIVPEFVIQTDSEVVEYSAGIHRQSSSESVAAVEMDDFLKIGKNYGEENTKQLTLIAKLAFFQKRFGKLDPKQSEWFIRMMAHASV